MSRRLSGWPVRGAVKSASVLAFWRSVVVGRRCVVAIGLVAVLAVSGLVLWLCVGSDTSAAVPRARTYAAFTQCLMTDSAGVASPSSAPVWAGLQKASSATTAKSQFLSVPADTPPTDVESYANTLIARNCDVIVAVGPAEVTALRAVAGANPDRRFVLVADVAPAANTAVIKPGPKVGDRLSRLLTDAFRGTFHPGTVS